MRLQELAFITIRPGPHFLSLPPVARNPKDAATKMLEGGCLSGSARQAELIRTLSPWQETTGPRTPDGNAIAGRNA